MSLTVGQPAPDFKLVDTEKKEHTLSNFRGKNVVLFFFPMAWTGVCTKEMCDVSQGLNGYTALNADVYGISGDNPFAQEAWAQKEQIKVTLLSDYEHKVTQAYGVAYDSFLPQLNLGMGGVPKRSAFVIDKEGVVRYAESSDDPKQLPNFDAIRETLTKLK